MKRLVFVLLFCCAFVLSTYGQSPVTDGLVLHVASDEIPDSNTLEYVSVWPDLSGNGNDLVPDESTKEPKFVDDVLNGKPVLRFDGLDDRMIFTNRIEDVRTIFFVLNEHPDATENWRCFISETAGELGSWHRGEFKAFWSVDWGEPEVYNGITRINHEIIDGTDRAIPITPVPTEHSVISHVTTANVGANQIACDRDASTRVWDGDMAEILIFNRVLSDEEMETVRIYLQRKYKINMFYPLNPTDGATDIIVSTSLEWEHLSEEVESFDVYLSADPNNLVLVSEGQTEKTFTPDTQLEFDTTYFWQVVAYEPNETSGIIEPNPSDLWTFTTRIDAPFILSQPTSIVADAGDTVQFTVVAESGSPLHYEWHKYVSQGQDPVVGVDSSILELTDISVDNEHFYYCLVSAEGSSDEIETDMAYLTIKRLYARWEFEDNLDDETGNGFDGMMSDMSEPNAFCIEGGINGKCFELFDDGNYIEFPGTEEEFNFYPHGYTMSIWVKDISGGNGWCSVIAKSTHWDLAYLKGAVGIMLMVVVDPVEDPTYAWAFTAIHGFGEAWADAPAVVDGDWHLLTSTYSEQTGMASIFVDGFFIEDVGPFGGPLTPWGGDLLCPDPVVIGAEVTAIDPDWLQTFYTKVDDARFYNYALSDLEILELYTTYTGPVCMEQPAGDVNADCKVDTLDLAEMINSWLESTLVSTP